MVFSLSHPCIFPCVFVSFMGFALAGAFLVFPLLFLNFLQSLNRAAMPRLFSGKQSCVGQLYGKDRVCTQSYGPCPQASEEAGREAWFRIVQGRNQIVG